MLEVIKQSSSFDEAVKHIELKVTVQDTSKVSVLPYRFVSSYFSCNLTVLFDSAAVNHAENVVKLVLGLGINPSMGTLQPQSSGPLCSNMMIGTLAINGWAVTFGTARRGLGGLRPHAVPSFLYQM